LKVLTIVANVNFGLVNVVFVVVFADVFIVVITIIVIKLDLV